MPVVAAFRQTHPQIELRFVSAFTGYLLDWLQRGEVDVAVLYDPQPTRSLRSKPLLLENLFQFGPPDAGLSAVRAVPFAHLAQHDLLLPSPRHGLRAIVERCADELGIRLKVSIETDLFQTSKDLVRHGYGMTVLPLAPIHGDIAAGRLSGSTPRRSEPRPPPRPVAAERPSGLAGGPLRGGYDHRRHQRPRRPRYLDRSTGGRLIYSRSI